MSRAASRGSKEVDAWAEVGAGGGRDSGGRRSAVPSASRGGPASSRSRRSDRGASHAGGASRGGTPSRGGGAGAGAPKEPSAYDMYMKRQEARDRQMATNYILGEDKPSWETEASLTKPHAFVAGAAAVKPNKNYSDSRDIFGSFKLPPEEMYASVSAAEFNPKSSAMSGSFARTKPLPGFDRMTANRTNYSLGAEEEKVEYKTSNMDATMHPSRMVPRGMNPTYKARVDGATPFNIVTGKDIDPSSTYVPAGKRTGADHFTSNVTRSTTYNLISGRVEPTVTAPPKRTSDAVAVPAPLRSLACLRPPTGQELL